ncbi:unnamed protein product [Somion occarium]|uniref:methionyl-tRNA formyltransferase n=1 Tax=Somion occarium TaxID=3059160 RepID=A0ABP1CYC7_9APHY
MLYRLCPKHSVLSLSLRCRNYSSAVSGTQSQAFDILFLGRDEFSCLVLEELHHAPDVWSTIQIATQPDMRVGRRGSKLAISPLKLLGQDLKLPVHTIPPDKPSFRYWKLPPPFLPSATPNPSHVLVTASFGRILPKSMLDIFDPSRKLNVHPSLLPAYRGAAPIHHTILNGERETGVCVIEMMERKKGIDAGSIWGKSQMTIPDDCDFVSLRDSLGREGGKLLVTVLRDMLAGKATAVPQDHNLAAPRAPFVTGQDAVVDFHTMTAQDIVRRCRAIAHQKPLHAFLQTGRSLQLHGVSMLDAAALSEHVLSQLMEPGFATYDSYSRSLVVRCSDGSILQAKQVKQQDRALLNAREWWNGVSPDLRAIRGSDSGPIILNSDSNIPSNPYEPLFEPALLSFMGIFTVFQ